MIPIKIYLHNQKWKTHGCKKRIIRRSKLRWIHGYGYATYGYIRTRISDPWPPLVQTATVQNLENSKFLIVKKCFSKIKIAEVQTSKSQKYQNAGSIDRIACRCTCTFFKRFYTIRAFEPSIELLIFELLNFRGFFSRLAVQTT